MYVCVTKKTMWQQVGDVLLCSAFLAYGGFFDQHFRDALSDQWRARLVAAGVPLKDGLAVSEYLSTPEQRLSWHADLVTLPLLYCRRSVL
jgi:hypothetical protein